MSNTHNREDEISADTYATVMRHQFNLESLGDRLQNIEDATKIMKEKWRRGDEAMRDFTERFRNDVDSEESSNFSYSGGSSSSNGDYDRDETRESLIRSRRRELRGRDEDRLVDPTRQTGKLDCLFGPTHPFGGLDDLFGPTHRTDELEGAFCPTRRTGELDDGAL
ncbi:hypothetical protein DY000_02040103 [Brassica cretica]|uniref:Uncharacterized protein n=1 Tax=Brassica cretica TaxID=69181 RepID=A0ABQ7BJV6_BRACR|nr:hypothetical protein DY000_02040103 [Brassica cretica]